MRILLTNDDGIQAEGLLALKRAVESLGEVFVVAPDRPRSASGHSITLHKPLRLHKTKLADGSTAYSSNGTPADCVTLGRGVVMEEKCDLVISGINPDANLGWDTSYSGTVSAAAEAAVLGVRAFAISVASIHEAPVIANFETAGEVARNLIIQFGQHEIPKNVLLNVNVPNVAFNEIKGIQITRQGSRQYTDRLITRTDPWGHPYYWLGGSLLPERALDGTDVYAVQSGYVSITPIHLDLTAYVLLDAMRDWVAKE